MVQIAPCVVAIARSSHRDQDDVRPCARQIEIENIVGAFDDDILGRSEKDGIQCGERCLYDDDAREFLSRRSYDVGIVIGIVGGDSKTPPGIGMGVEYPANAISHYREDPSMTFHKSPLFGSEMKKLGIRYQKFKYLARLTGCIFSVIISIRKCLSSYIPMPEEPNNGTQKNISADEAVFLHWG